MVKMNELQPQATGTNLPNRTQKAGEATEYTSDSIHMDPKIRVKIRIKIRVKATCGSKSQDSSSLEEEEGGGTGIHTQGPSRMF